MRKELQASAQRITTSSSRTPCHFPVTGVSWLLIAALYSLPTTLGGKLELDIEHKSLFPYGRSIFCTFNFGATKVETVVDTGSSDFFFLWKEWYEGETKEGACNDFPLGCYTCPEPCNTVGEHVVTFDDGVNVTVCGYKGKVRIGSIDVPDLSFGLMCGQEPPPSGSTPISSVGLGPSRKEGYNSLIDQLKNSRLISSSTFAIYLWPTDGYKGKLLLGEGDPSIYKHPLHYVKLKSKNRYSVALSGMQFGNHRQINFINQYVWLDTGTNFIAVCKTYFTDLVRIVESQASKKAGAEVPITWNRRKGYFEFPCEYRSIMPVITFLLGDKGDVPLALNHMNYVLESSILSSF